MGNYTREEILQMAEEEDVEFIRLQFTDMFGTLKNIAITARELPRALDNRCIVDGSFIAGIAGESEPDMYLRPDLDTFAILPWRPQQGKVARLLCLSLIHIFVDRRIHLMEEEGVKFVTNVNVGKDIKAEELLKQFDRVILALSLIHI